MFSIRRIIPVRIGALGEGLAPLPPYCFPRLLIKHLVELVKGLLDCAASSWEVKCALENLITSVLKAAFINYVVIKIGETPL